jgi:hypothetical protein
MIESSQRLVPQSRLPTLRTVSLSSCHNLPARLATTGVRPTLEDRCFGLDDTGAFGRLLGIGVNSGFDLT